MRKAWVSLLAAAICPLAACTSEPPQSEAAKQAEAAEARMDAEAARMVLAADSVRAAGAHLADSLSALPQQPKPKHAPAR